METLELDGVHIFLDLELMLSENISCGCHIPRDDDDNDIDDDDDEHKDEGNFLFPGHWTFHFGMAHSFKIRKYKNYCLSEKNMF